MGSILRAQWEFDLHIGPAVRYHQYFKTREYDRHTLPERGATHDTIFQLGRLQTLGAAGISWHPDADPGFSRKICTFRTKIVYLRAQTELWDRPQHKSIHNQP